MSQNSVFFGTKIPQSQLNLTPVFPEPSFLIAFSPENWKFDLPKEASQPGEVTEDNKLEKIIKNPSLKFSPAQIEAIENFIATITNETTGTLGGIPEFEHLTNISIIDYRDQKGGRCHIALQKGIDSHLIRFGYQVILDSKSGEEAANVIFGITCLGHVKGLTKEQTTLIKGLNRWKSTSITWMRKQMQNAARTGVSIEEYFRIWLDSFPQQNGFEKFQSALQLILSKPEKLATCYQGIKSLNFTARTLSAVKAASYLLQNRLPVPFELVRRVELGAKKLR